MVSEADSEWKPLGRFLRLSVKPLCQCGTNNACSWDQECLLIASKCLLMEPRVLIHGTISAYSWTQECLLMGPRVLTHDKRFVVSMPDLLRQSQTQMVCVLREPSA